MVRTLTQEADIIYSHKYVDTYPWQQYGINMESPALNPTHHHHPTLLLKQPPPFCEGSTLDSRPLLGHLYPFSHNCISKVGHRWHVRRSGEQNTTVFQSRCLEALRLGLWAGHISASRPILANYVFTNLVLCTGASSWNRFRPLSFQWREILMGQLCVLSVEKASHSI